MLTDERHAYILEKIKHEDTVKLIDLKKEMNCSTSTVRRDLSTLEKEGLLTRVHGGAKRIYAIDSEKNIKEKSFKNVQEKKKIAKHAASLVENKDIIYLDAGTTTYEMIPYLTNKEDILVVTNGVMHSQLLADHEIPTILIGGMIKGKTKAIIGAVALKQLKEYRFNKTFLGINGIDKEFGYTTPDIEEAALKKEAGKLASKTFVLADHTKFRKVNFAKVSELENYIIITDYKKDLNIKKFKKATVVQEVKE